MINFPKIKTVLGGVVGETYFVWVVTIICYDALRIAGGHYSSTSAVLLSMSVINGAWLVFVVVLAASAPAGIVHFIGARILPPIFQTRCCVILLGVAGGVAMNWILPLI